MVELAKKKRVLVEYKSESRGEFVDVGDMNHEHLVNLVRKMVTRETMGEFRFEKEDGTKVYSFLGQTTNG